MADEMDRVIGKAKLDGIIGLTKNERHTFNRAVHEGSPRGRVAREVKDGKK